MAYNETPTERTLMERFTANLKRQIEENPIVAIAVTAALFTAMSKLMDANTARQAAKTHALEVNRRIAMSAMK